MVADFIFNKVETEIMKRSRKTQLIKNKRKIFDLPEEMSPGWSAVKGIYYSDPSSVIKNLSKEITQAEAMEKILSEKDLKLVVSRGINNYLERKFRVAKKHRDTKTQIIF